MVGIIGLRTTSNAITVGVSNAASNVLFPKMLAQGRYRATFFHYSAIFNDNFKKLLIDQIDVDVVLTNGTEALHVHKNVLKMSSPYFKENLPDFKKVFVRFNTKFSIIQSIVEFIYSGETEYDEADMKELIAAARFLQIKGLSEIPFEGDLPEFAAPTMFAETENQPMKFARLPLNFYNPGENGTEIDFNQDFKVLQLNTVPQKRGRPKKSFNKLDPELFVASKLLFKKIHTNSALAIESLTNLQYLESTNSDPNNSEDVIELSE